MLRNMHSVNEVVFNGVKYGSVEEMPPEIRRQFEAVMSGLQNLPEGVNTVTTRKLVVNNREYGSPDELPPDERKLYEEALSGSGGRDGLKVSRHGASGFSLSFSTSTQAKPLAPAETPGKAVRDSSTQDVAVLQERLNWAKTWLVILAIALTLFALAFLFLR